MAMKKERKKVIVSLWLRSVPAWRQLAGVFRQISRGLKWDVIWQPEEDKVEQVMTNGSADGVITTVPLQPDTAKRLSKLDIPVVAIDIPEPLLPKIRLMSKVYSDDFNIGNAGATHILGFGNFRSYAFVPSRDSRNWSKQREMGFCETIRAKGRDVAVFVHPDDLDENPYALRNWLKGLPKPTAIMTASDKLASEVIQAAHSGRIKVPKEVAVIGTDDSEIICENTRPRLTSVRPGHEACGYVAAEELARLMRGCKPCTRIIPHEKITDRESLAVCIPATHLVATADSYIEEHAVDGIGVDDVARYLHVSRRLLSLRYAEFMQESIHCAIVRRRLEKVCELLVKTDMPIMEISARCGFANNNYLKNLFRNRFGVPMRDWRAQNRVR